MKYSLFLIGFLLYVSALGLEQFWMEYGYVHQGVQVVDFMQDSPALAAGFQKQDIILAFDSTLVRTAQEFVSVLQQKKPTEIIFVATLKGMIPVILGTDPLTGTARFGAYVETVQTPRTSVFFAFTFEKLLTLVYWIGLAYLLGGTALLFQKTSPFLEGAALNILNILDIVTTNLFLKQGHVEGNPVGQFLLEQLGFGYTAILKFVLVFAASCILVKITNHPSLAKKKITRTLITQQHIHLKGSVLAYTFVVLVNLGVLL